MHSLLFPDVEPPAGKGATDMATALPPPPLPGDCGDSSPVVASIGGLGLSEPGEPVGLGSCEPVIPELGGLDPGRACCGCAQAASSRTDMPATTTERTIRGCFNVIPPAIHVPFTRSEQRVSRLIQRQSDDIHVGGSACARDGPGSPLVPARLALIVRGQHLSASG